MDTAACLWLMYEFVSVTDRWRYNSWPIVNKLDDVDRFLVRSPPSADGCQLTISHRRHHSCRRHSFLPRPLTRYRRWHVGCDASDSGPVVRRGALDGGSRHCCTWHGGGPSGSTCHREVYARVANVKESPDGSDEATGVKLQRQSDARLISSMHPCILQVELSSRKLQSQNSRQLMHFARASTFLYDIDV